MVKNPTLRAAAVLAAVFTISPAVASAQLFPRLFGGGRCAPCEGYGGYAEAYAPPMTAWSGGYQNVACGSPCEVAAAPVPVATACTCVQPVQQTVYREVPVTKYRSVKKTVKVPVQRTAYVEKDVTVYRTVNETKTAEVPYTTYQTVSSCETAQVDNSRWQTSYQRNCKVSPCQYDPRPGFRGWWNRTGYSMRSAFTPNVIARRQYVRDVRTVARPVTRQIPITATRTVTYNVARVVPTVEKQRVAVLQTEMRDQVVTAMEPYTEMQTVAVGTTTQMAYVGGFNGTATALAPTPAPSQTAREEPVEPRTRTADGAEGNFDLNSYETPRDQPRQDRFSARVRPRSEGPRTRSTVRPETPQQVASRKVTPDTGGWSARKSPKTLRVTAWRSSRGSGVDAPALKVAAK